jgi:hypothetical protein
VSRTARSCTGARPRTTDAESGVRAGRQVGRHVNAAPRKNAKGEASIRPYRIGTHSGIREIACDCSSVTGSRRCFEATTSASADLGRTYRRDRPSSRRSSIDKPPAVGFFESGPLAARSAGFDSHRCCISVAAGGQTLGGPGSGR